MLKNMVESVSNEFVTIIDEYGGIFMTVQFSNLVLFQEVILIAIYNYRDIIIEIITML